MSAATSSKTAGPSIAAPATDGEIERMLSREATAFQRDVEVDRILKAFKLNPYEILDLDDVCKPEEIKKKFRQLSLFIHPDKCPHARAPEAFDLLKKAEQELSDENKRGELDSLITRARSDLLKSHGIPTTVQKDDLRVISLVPPFKQQLRAKVKEMLIEEEVRRRKAIKNNLANEGFEAQKKEVEVQTRKRKAEDDKAWEEGREQRVGSWRNFSTGGGPATKKKKVAKKNVMLG
ncbi:chaperone regulator [Auriculariales sp. MPI-PUGE-AT-0066]|nr:chaperone regulator [Auriculariales sp. MPI-PUGE-AT-0066]